MTTTVKVHVNGKYRTTIGIETKAYGKQTVVVDGDQPGGREHVFGLHHPAEGVITIKEGPLTDEMIEVRDKPVDAGTTPAA
jgi:hypothetical protein